MGRSDIHFVDCPVSGGAIRAAAGTLSIMAGADDKAIEKARFLLEELTGETTLYIVNGGMGQGSNMKMVHQVFAAIQILSTSEGLGLAARLQLDPHTVKDAVINGDAWTWMFENRSPRVLEQDYFPGVSALTIILKDTVSWLSSGARISWC